MTHVSSAGEAEDCLSLGRSPTRPDTPQASRQVASRDLTPYNRRLWVFGFFMFSRNGPGRPGVG